MKTVHLCSLSLLALAAASPALADTGAPSNDDIVVTATGTAQPRDEVGQAITIIDADTIRRRQSLTVSDLLLTTPGVRSVRNGNIGSVTGVSLRGAETTQTLVLIDGVRVNDPTGIGNQFDFGSLLVGNINRIEVLRGSNSIVYGSQAIGGVVNVMSPAAEPGAPIALNASAEYGYADTVDAKANISGSTGILAASGGVAYFRTDGISSVPSNFGASEKDGYKNLTANARLLFSFSDAVSLDLRGYYIHSNLDYDSFFGAPQDTDDTAVTGQYVGYAGLNVALFDGAFKNRVAVTYYRQDRDYYANSVFGTDFGYIGKNWRFEYQGTVQPVEEARLIFGYEHENPKYREYGYSTGRYQVNIDSVYALAVIKPLSGLAVTAGLRYDDHSQFGSATTFGANANYSPNGGATNFRIAYGEGFKAPSMYQLYDPFSGNATLKPERSKSYDIGIDQSALDGRLQASITLFRRTIRDQINYDPALGLFGGYNNIDLTKAKGIEFSLTLKPVDALEVTADYSYIAAFDRSPTSPNFNNWLARRAPHSLSLSADYDWPFGLSTGATMTVVDNSFDREDNARRLEGYVLTGIRASLPIAERFELFGRIDNLFDVDYTTAYGYSNYGRAAYAGVRVKI